MLVALLIAAGACWLLTADSRAARDPQAWQWRVDVWMPMHWQRLAQCESGSNPPDWRHHTDYEGGFGFAPSTWDRFKLSARWPHGAHLATPWQQWRTARALTAHYRSIRGSFGCWRGADHAWVRGGLPEYGTWR